MRSTLKNERLIKNLTQEELSQKVGITRAAYTNIELGYKNPSVEVAKKIAEILDFDWTRFYDTDSED